MANNNVTDMSYMFSKCDSLNSFPDLSKWNTQELINIKDIIKGCEQLSESIKLPKIFK